MQRGWDGDRMKVPEERLRERVCRIIRDGGGKRGFRGEEEYDRSR
jgi:hypothetical protein